MIRELNTILSALPTVRAPSGATWIDPGQPVTALLVSGYGGLGIHPSSRSSVFSGATTRTSCSSPLGVVVDSGRSGRVRTDGGAPERETEHNLKRYVAFANNLG